jgi:hypothetical protein
MMRREAPVGPITKPRAKPDIIRDPKEPLDGDQSMSEAILARDRQRWRHGAAGDTVGELHMLNSHDENIGIRVRVKRSRLVGGIQQTIDKVENGLYLIAKELAFYEVALGRIINEQPDSAGAEIARAALRNFGKR